MKKRAYYSFRPIICITLLLFVCGCWSSRDIEKLDMLLGVGIDLAGDEQTHNKSEGETPLIMTFQLANVNEGQGMTEQTQHPTKPYVNVEETGSTMLQIARDFLLKRDNLINGQHQKLIVLSNEIAKDRSIRNYIDFYTRDPAIRTSCLVLMTDDKAKDILDFEKGSEIPTLHIIETSKRTDRSTKIIEALSIAKLNAKINSNTSFLLQNVAMKDDEIALEGASIIKGSTLTYIGSLNKDELDGLAWVTGSADGGVISINDKHATDNFVYEVRSLRSKVEPSLNNGDISFEVKIESQGLIAETHGQSDEMTKEGAITRLEGILEDEVRKKVEHTLKTLQEEYQVDVADFGTSVRINEPAYWKEHKDEWDSIFSNSSIKLDIDITVTDTGLNYQN